MTISTEFIASRERWPLPNYWIKRPDTNGRQPDAAIPRSRSRVQEGPDARGAARLPQENVAARAQAQGQRKAAGRTQDQDQRRQGGSRARTQKAQKGRRQLQVSQARGRPGDPDRRPQRGQEPAAHAADAGHAGGGPVSVHHARAARRHDGLGRRQGPADRHAAHHRRLHGRLPFAAWFVPPTPPF